MGETQRPAEEDPLAAAKKSLGEMSIDQVWWAVTLSGDRLRELAEWHEFTLTELMRREAEAAQEADS
jgi:hypothetical protein